LADCALRVISLVTVICLPREVWSTTVSWPPRAASHKTVGRCADQEAQEVAGRGKFISVLR
jgi:hypothetical protein